MTETVKRAGTLFLRAVRYPIELRLQGNCNGLTLSSSVPSSIVQSFFGQHISKGSQTALKLTLLSSVIWNDATSCLGKVRNRCCWLRGHSKAIRNTESKRNPTYGKGMQKELVQQTSNKDCISSCCVIKLVQLNTSDKSDLAIQSGQWSEQPRCKQVHKKHGWTSNPQSPLFWLCWWPVPFA